MLHVWELCSPKPKIPKPSSQVMRVLRVWEVWSLYPPEFIARLEATFLGKEYIAPGEKDAVSGSLDPKHLTI